MHAAILTTNKNTSTLFIVSNNLTILQILKTCFHKYPQFYTRGHIKPHLHNFCRYQPCLIYRSYSKATLKNEKKKTIHRLLSRDPIFLTKKQTIICNAVIELQIPIIYRQSLMYKEVEEGKFHLHFLTYTQGYFTCTANCSVNKLKKSTKLWIYRNSWL